MACKLQLETFEDLIMVSLCIEGINLNFTRTSSRLKLPAIHKVEIMVNKLMRRL